MELKPCPFCGGAAEVKSSRVPTNGGKSYVRGWVGCKTCGAYMQWSFEPSGTVRKWNRRTEARADTSSGPSGHLPLEGKAKRGGA